MAAITKVAGKRMSTGDKIFKVFVYTLSALVALVAIYPMLYVLSSSFSSPDAVTSGRVVLFPVEFTLDAYKAILEYKDVWVGYANTIFYAVIGTVINVVFTVMTAYPLSRKSLFGNKQITFLLTFTLMFNAGLIPTYMLMKNMGMVNTRSVVILLGLMGVKNIILARTFYGQTISNELIEAAKIDGANEFQILMKIVVPLSKAIIAVIALYTFVDYWNEFFNSMIYLNDDSKYPLQLILREILIMNTIDPSVTPVDPATMNVMFGMSELLKYAVIVVASLPIMCLYPLAQKYFVKGVMVGAVKG